MVSAYREAGWIAQVYLPEQDVNEGTITLQVIEARFAGVRLEGELPKRVASAVGERARRARLLAAPLFEYVADLH